MTAYTEQSEFVEEIEQLGRGSGLKGAERRLNPLLQAIINRTRFLKEQSTGAGAGFVYGGELNATPTYSTQPAEFNVLDNGSIDDGVFTPNSPIGFAMSTYIAIAETVPQIFRFTWPSGYTSGDTFSIGFCTPSAETDMQNIFAGTNTGMVGIGHSGGSIFAVHKYGNEAPTMDAASNIVASNDIVRIEFYASTNIVSITNETTNLSLAAFDLGNYADFSGSLSLFIYSMTAISFAQDNTSPVLQEITNITVPEEADGKTYLVTNATADSKLNGKTLKNGDFITFFANGTDGVVTRLISDYDIGIIAENVANAVINTKLAIGGDIQVAINNAITNEVMAGGIIDGAIQAVLNP